MADTRLRKRGTKNGRDVWTALIPLAPGPNGERRRHRFTSVGNKTDADKALVAKLHEIAQDGFITSDRVTFGEYLAEWLTAAKTRYAATTWHRYKSMVDIHLMPSLGRIPLQRLSAAQLNRAYADWQQKDGLSGQTALHHHRLVHRVLGVAMREGRLRQNVAALTERPRAQRHERRHFSRTEIERIMKVAVGSAFWPLIALALATGARRGELLALRWSDVDLDRGAIAIRRSLEQTKDGVREKQPKNGKQRVVDLPATAVGLLKRHRLRQASKVGIGPGYVFPGPEGEAWTPHKVTDGFREILRKAKIESGSFHSLRHTAATQMLELEVPPKIVQERLGHSTIAITIDLYSHATPSLQAEAARRLDVMLGPLLDEQA
jgi:integrase